MKPEFSELSFAFAYMSELVKKLSTAFTVAPSFPSTVLEGQKGFGYDVKIGFGGIPVFLQFKLAHCMTHGSATEFARRVFAQGMPANPVYRFYLMALGESRQTALMLKLEKKHDLVFYVAPAFHKTAELDAHFVNSSVGKNSRSIRPSRIKRMPDKLQHFVSYRLLGPCHRFSDAPSVVDTVRKSLVAAIKQSDAREVHEEVVLESLLSILDGEDRSLRGIHLDRETDPFTSAQFLARTYFGCELVFLRRRAP